MKVEGRGTLGAPVVYAPPKPRVQRRLDRADKPPTPVPPKPAQKPPGNEVGARPARLPKQTLPRTKRPPMACQADRNKGT